MQREYLSSSEARIPRATKGSENSLLLERSENTSDRAKRRLDAPQARIPCLVERSENTLVERSENTLVERSENTLVERSENTSTQALQEYLSSSTARIPVVECSENTLEETS